MPPDVAQRCVEREWLDDLPLDDPRAARSRRDLRTVNRIMGHAGLLCDALARNLRTATPRIAELGAGDGTLLLRALRKARKVQRAEIVLVDTQPAVGAESIAEYEGRGHRVTIAVADAAEWLVAQRSTYDALVANLFLHHLQQRELEALFALASAHTSLFIACEPRRARLPLAGSHMLGLIGCNDITRHDAVLSVRAGFTARELSALWPTGNEWTLTERRAGVFSHVFIAAKAAAQPKLG
ncbi:MAG TPA: methyltransferase domain-containing protein [Burkholderiales bacterium]|nr:methyltransferase domain-containing protein [Burkholderiales bacterium]